MMSENPVTRHSRRLPQLHFSLQLLYVGRLLLGMNSSPAESEDRLEAIDEQIEAANDELIATELLHQAAILAGDVREDPTPSDLN